MRPAILRRYRPQANRHAKADGLAGLVLGVESVPDGLASGLLAGVNPVAGVYAYLFGMVGASLFTGSALMAVQSTGAMSIIVADVDLASRSDPSRALFTLTIITGVLMLVAGLMRLGGLLRFVSGSVMTGFVAAVGVNIVLGQLENFTGYAAHGQSRVTRSLDLLTHPGRVDPATLAVGAVTVALILLLQRSRLGALGLVVAVVVGSVAAALFARFGHPIPLVADVADVPSSLPLPRLPDLREVPGLAVPAASLAFVGLVQGAGVSAALPRPGRDPVDPSRDFVGQGAGNIVAGVFQGMPVGGSMSASSLAVSAGARTRASLLCAGAVMAFVVVVLASVVERVAMPALAGLLIVVGCSTVKPRKVIAVGRTGAIPCTVMVITLILTMVTPLQYAVLVGVGLSVVLFVIGQSSRLTIRQLILRDDGAVVEQSPPSALGHDEVVVLQPYGAMFFATASVLYDQMPSVTSGSTNSVVVLRLRGTDPAGVTLLDVLADYASALDEVGSQLMIVTDNERFVEQLDDAGISAFVRVFAGSPVVGATTRAAYDEARAWVAGRGDV